jgi:hypothetical protein
MTINKLKYLAVETLTYFLRVMPEAPFTEDDIIIEFAKKKDMARRARELCAMYVPDKIINESQTRQLNKSIAANALIGREKSAVIVCSDYKTTINKWRVLFFHEFMHIFCGKTEMDGEHFIDIYGSGTTPDENPENKIYDGVISAGYAVWSEFIAQYYALSNTGEDEYDFSDAMDYINKLLCEVSVAANELSKGSFSMACAYLLTYGDVDEILNPDPADENPDPALYEKENKAALLNCLWYLYEQMQTERPWKISEGFIETLGNKFNFFRVMNSLYLGQISIGNGSGFL